MPDSTTDIPAKSSGPDNRRIQPSAGLRLFEEHSCSCLEDSYVDCSKSGSSCWSQQHNSNNNRTSIADGSDFCSPVSSDCSVNIGNVSAAMRAKSPPDDGYINSGAGYCGNAGIVVAAGDNLQSAGKVLPARDEPGKVGCPDLSYCCDKNNLNCDDGFWAGNRLARQPATGRRQFDRLPTESMDHHPGTDWSRKASTKTLLGCGRTRPRNLKLTACPQGHSYSDCCVNIPVSRILEHWLATPTYTQQHHTTAVNNNNTQIINTTSAGLSNKTVAPSSFPVPYKSIFPPFHANNTATVSSRNLDFHPAQMSTELTASKAPANVAISTVNPQCNTTGAFGQKSGEHRLLDALLTAFNVSSLVELRHCRQSRTGRTPLHVIMTAQIQDPRPGKNSDPRMEISNLPFSLPAHCQREMPAAVERLINLGLDANARDELGDTPLTLVNFLLEQELYSLAAQLAAILVRAGGNVNHRNKSGRSALEYSLRHLDAGLEVTRVLVDGGAALVHEPLANECSGGSRSIARLPTSQTGDSYPKQPLASLLQGILRKQRVELAEQCLDMFGQELSQGREAMRSLVLKSIVSEARHPYSKSLDLMMSVRERLASYWRQPQALGNLCLQTIRSALTRTAASDTANGTASTLRRPATVKRLVNDNRKAVEQLRLPKRLQDMIRLKLVEPKFFAPKSLANPMPKTNTLKMQPPRDEGTTIRKRARELDIQPLPEQATAMADSCCKTDDQLAVNIRQLLEGLSSSQSV